MHSLLSRAFPEPDDEPHPRDVVGPAIRWGDRRRHRDWALTGAAALAVVMVGAGAAVLGGGGSEVPASPGSGGIAGSPPGAADQSWTPPKCTPAGSEYCKLMQEEQDFGADYAKKSLPYIQAALPTGFTVKATDTYVLVLTGPDGKTNYLFPSVTGADTLEGRAPECGTPPRSGCLQTSEAGGDVVVNGGPTAGQSAGWVKDGLKDPRITINVGTAPSDSINGLPKPTGSRALLTNQQLAAIIGDAAYVQFSDQEYAHLVDINQRLHNLPQPTQSSPVGMSPGSSHPVGWSSPGATAPSTGR
ncbi:MAG: hypothetical protein HOW97_39260 [Catenulispora sp.]|nr:hypothetical protein [Catenulispora sp.]